MGRDNTELISILEAHKGIIYKITNAYAKDLEDRKDLEQEIIIQIWRSLSNFNKQSKLSTWVYRVALNVSIAYNRKHKNRARLNNPMDSVIVETTIAPEPTSKSERSYKLHAFINELDKFNKAILLLYLDDYSYEEIADIIGITKSNIGVKINRIKQQLKNRFTPENTN